MSSIDQEISHVQAIGHGVISLVNGAILIAIVAVLLSNNANTAGMIQAFFQFLAWLVATVVTPLNAGTNVTLGSTLQPAGGYGVTGSGNNSTTTSTTTSTAALTASNQTLTYAPGTPTAGLSLPSSTPTCYSTVNGRLVEVIANADGTCPGVAQ